ncbi:hypothetical protein R1flu_017967 [Riccia fluitans]|uniref:N-acetyltransferase domain-containing protein n=1 Tax=Riccia fluitans TaxID=41844 RepID=A0ABD1ZHW4_9MARC
MGTLIPLTQMGPHVSFLPPIGLFSISEPDYPGCYKWKASFKGDFLSSFPTSTSCLSSRREFCPSAAVAAAKTTAVVSAGALRTHSAYVANAGNELGLSVAIQRSRNGAFEKLKVRSLVDEATASSIDLEELGTSFSTSQNNDSEAGCQFSEFELEQTKGREQQDRDAENVDSTERESSSARDEEYGPGIIIEEAATSPIEMDYEDMKHGKEKNWSIADMNKLDELRNFEYRVETGKGDLIVQALKAEHMKAVEELLVDSFAELMGGLLTYRPLLTLTVRQYVRERYACLPAAVTLVGLYAPEEDVTDAEDADVAVDRRWLLAGTVELSFSNIGHPDIPPGPSPPRGSPYLCNMAVSTDYRRRGIGQQMLKAAEMLAEAQGCEDIYLHCRIMDTAPLSMYKGAGYEIVATDSFLSLLSFQRRRYLMKKKLYPRFPSDDEVTDSDTDSSSFQE